jgi:hypothetical protein
MLSPAEQNYKVFNRELLGIIKALYHWSHLLRGTPEPIIIWTDHRNLMYWCEPHKVGPHVATWQVELQQYHYELRYKPGENMCTDALSRCPDFDTGNPMNDHLICYDRPLLFPLSYPPRYRVSHHSSHPPPHQPSKTFAVSSYLNPRAARPHHPASNPLSSPRRHPPFLHYTSRPHRAVVPVRPSHFPNPSQLRFCCF